MIPTSKFEITRRRTVLNASGTYSNAALAASAAGTVTAVRGLALGPKTNAGVDEKAFDVANGKGFYGHLTRRVVVGGLSLTDRVFGVTSTEPVGLEGPFTNGEEVSVERAEELECEGADLIMTSGSGAITTATALNTALSFKQGKLYVAQSGDVAYYTLAANNLTPMDDGNNDLRIRAVGV